MFHFRKAVLQNNIMSQHFFFFWIRHRVTHPRFLYGRGIRLWSEFLLVKSRGELGKSARTWEKLQNLQRPGGLCSPPLCWSQSVYCLSGDILNLVHFTYEMDVHSPTHAPTSSHPHTDEEEAPLSACSKSPWRCLFTLHCDSFVCWRVCVDLRGEILRVKCSRGLHYHFWVLSHHPTSPG